MNSQKSIVLFCLFCFSRIFKIWSIYKFIKRENNSTTNSWCNHRRAKWKRRFKYSRANLYWKCCMAFFFSLSYVSSALTPLVLLERFFVLKFSIDFHIARRLFSCCWRALSYSRCSKLCPRNYRVLYSR